MSTTSNTPVLSRAIHGHVDPQVEHVINLLANGLKDAHDAIANLKGQHDALKTTVASVSTTATQAQTTATQTATAQAQPVAAGQVRQATVSSTARASSPGLSVQQSDHLGLVVIPSGSAAGTLTLNNLVQAPYTTRIFNQSGSAWTLQPSAAASLVNGSASHSLAAGQAVSVYFDGMNWTAA